MRTGLHYLVEVGLVDDSRRTLQKLLQLLRRNEDRGFLEKAWERMRDRHRPIEEQGSRTDKPMKPQVVAWELSKRLSDTAIVSSDSDTLANCRLRSASNRPPNSPSRWRKSHLTAAGWAQL